MISNKYLDYEFSLGLFKNVSEVKDFQNINYKLNALLHILNTPPGTHQDNPYLGMDTHSLLFIEGEDEIAQAQTEFKVNLMRQANLYIEEGFISDINTIMERDASNGEVTVTANIYLSNGGEVQVESRKDDTNRLTFSYVNFDKTDFSNKSNSKIVDISDHTAADKAILPIVDNDNVPTGVYIPDKNINNIVGTEENEQST